MKLKRLIIFFVLSILIGKQEILVSQNVINDTANYPYWIAMMQDPRANFYSTLHAFDVYWKDRPITKGCGWKVFKRWEYMKQNRINHDGSRPVQDATLKAYQASKMIQQIQYGNWVSLGPATIPAPGPAGYEGLGRLNTIAFHPTDQNKMYVGAPSGGFWLTTDGGASWMTSTDSLPTLGVSSIVVDYSNPDQIFIGTGDRDADDAPGIGVYRSTDGGISWYASNTGMGNSTVGQIIQDPQNPLMLLAATNNGIFRSSDGGANWINIKTGTFKDIRFNPGDPNLVYATANSSFYRSVDNGLTFTKITAGLPAGLRSVIGVSAANADYVYVLMSKNTGGFMGLYRSTDAGLTFSTRSDSPNILDYTCDGSLTGGQGWYDLAIAVDHSDAEIVYAGGIDVWRSTDGGQNWIINSHWWGGCSVPPVHADCHYLAFSPGNNTLFACNDGGLFGTTDEGVSWPFYSESMTIGQIYKIGGSQTVKEKIINGFQDNGTYMYTANGWIQMGGGDGMECAIDPTDASYTFHTTSAGDIYRRISNAGQSHIAGYGINGITEIGGWVTPFILSTSSHSRMFVGYRNIWRSDDIVTLNSIVFTKISDNLAGSNGIPMTAIAQSEADSNLFFAIRADRKLFRSDNCLDANPLWIDLSSAWPSVLSGTSLATHPTNPNIVYLTAGKQVFKSINKGLSWAEITGNLPAVSINTLVYYKNVDEGLYLGTDAGVYYSDNTTNGWVAFNHGLPTNGIITELEIYYDHNAISEDAIRASSYGRGLWSSEMFSTTATGIIEDITNRFILYPNPSEGMFTIESKLIPPVHLSVLSIEGLELLSKDYYGNTQSFKEILDLRSFAKGIYIIRIIDKKHNYTGKLILK